jgi:hypothetical protein
LSADFKEKDERLVGVKVLEGMRPEEKEVIKLNKGWEVSRKARSLERQTWGHGSW